MVYLSLMLQSPLVFFVGELICLLSAPYVVWKERKRLREWWLARGKCPACGSAAPYVKGICTKCGHADILR